MFLYDSILKKPPKDQANIQPSTPSDPGGRVVTDVLQHSCLLERAYLICRLCCHHAVVYAPFSLIIPAK